MQILETHGDVCGEQRTEEDGREVMCVDCGFVVGDKKGKRLEEG